MKKKYLILIVTFSIMFILALSYGIYMSKDEIMIWIRGNNENKEEKLNYDNIEVVSSCNNPIIPFGFKKVETEDASWELDENGNTKGWNNGLVIEDEIGNQFVWVPYMGEKYNRYYYNADEKIYESVIRYSGFYMSRYEAGLPEERQNIYDNISSETNNFVGIPVSKKGVIPWNYINMRSAKLSAEKMYEDKLDIFSSLVNDENFISSWMYEASKGIYTENKGNLANSTFVFTGLYSNDEGKSYTYGKDILKEVDQKILLSTGTCENHITNNIYDYYGNLSECYIERISEYGYLYGRYVRTNYYVTSYSSAERPGFNTPLSGVGFRIGIYLK